MRFDPATPLSLSVVIKLDKDNETETAVDIFQSMLAKFRKAVKRTNQKAHKYHLTDLLQGIKYLVAAFSISEGQNRGEM